LEKLLQEISKIRIFEGHNNLKNNSCFPIFYIKIIPRNFQDENLLIAWYFEKW